MSGTTTITGRSVAILVFRVLAVAYLVYGSQGNHHPAFLDYIREKYGGRYEYLTFLGLQMSLATMLVALLESLIGNTRFSLIFIAIMLPVEILISIMFWFLFFFKPDLLIPRALIEAGATVPLPINIAQHLAPAVFLAIEFAIVQHLFSFSIWHMAWTTILVFGYFMWQNFLFTKNNSWTYPILGHLSESQRMAMFVIGWAFCLGTNYLMHLVAESNRRLWKQLDAKPTASKAKSSRRTKTAA